MKAARLLTAFLFLLAAIALPAQQIRTVKGVYTFYGERSHSPEDCRRLALEGARIAALAKEFGTTVSQALISDETINGDKENTFFRSMSETEVRGEWIEDVGQPAYTMHMEDDGTIVVTCTVQGRAREISNNAPDFTATVLRNGADSRYADTRFRSGDDMKLLFQSPVDGYLAVYLVGDDDTAYTMLPYSTSADGSVKVKHGKEYVFFDNARGDSSHGEVDEMQLVTDADVEHDRFYIVFSPKVFVKANDSFSGDSLPRSLPLSDFRKWLSKVRKNDPSLGVKTIDITIQNNR